MLLRGTDVRCASALAGGLGVWGFGGLGVWGFG